LPISCALAILWRTMNRIRDGKQQEATDRTAPPVDQVTQGKGGDKPAELDDVVSDRVAFHGVHFLLGRVVTRGAGISSAGPSRTGDLLTVPLTVIWLLVGGVGQFGQPLGGPLRSAGHIRPPLPPRDRHSPLRAPRPPCRCPCFEDRLPACCLQSAGHVPGWRVRPGLVELTLTQHQRLAGPFHINSST
jgi:hypothetical protein